MKVLNSIQANVLKWDTARPMKAFEIKHDTHRRMVPATHASIDDDHDNNNKQPNNGVCLCFFFGLITWLWTFHFHCFHVFLRYASEACFIRFWIFSAIFYIILFHYRQLSIRTLKCDSETFMYSHAPAQITSLDEFRFFFCLFAVKVFVNLPSKYSQVSSNRTRFFFFKFKKWTFLIGQTKEIKHSKWSHFSHSIQIHIVEIFFCQISRESLKFPHFGVNSIALRKFHL